MKKTQKKKSWLRRKTHRMRGGIRGLKEIIDSTPMKPNMLVNPNSKFVVVTYWWGRGNINRNTQKPCQSQIDEVIKEDLEEELLEDVENIGYKTLYNGFIRYRDIYRSGKYTEEQLDEYKKTRDARIRYLKKYFARPNVIATIKRLQVVYFEKYKEAIPIKFEEMITKWENTCKKAGCNYMAVEYPEFAQPGGYQLAINAKPLFIRKAIEACQGRAVLYIDGDMFMNKYPSIFDIANVDFMARGWNVDPRSSELYKTLVCFDPYIFETSGGTMYFANSDPSKMLLDAWWGETSKPESAGKADDRILSQVFTRDKFALPINHIQLPIEYLWLTDHYHFQDPADVSQKDAFIEHPACLTTEDVAASQGAASNRQPVGYTEEIEESVVCERIGGVFYEFIFFDNKNMVSSFEPYLTYLSKVKNPETGAPLFSVVRYDDKYGPKYTQTAMKNLEAIKLITTFVPHGLKVVNVNYGVSIPQILFYLNKDIDVNIGGSAKELPKNIEIVCNLVPGKLTKYLDKLEINTSMPMYFSSKNRIIRQLLAMCSQLSDINTHLKESYLFLSRIRWKFYNVKGMPNVI
jgi:hypothetical protein